MPPQTTPTQQIRMKALNQAPDPPQFPMMKNPSSQNTQTTPGYGYLYTLQMEDGQAHTNIPES
eukprot:8645928-Ditylum_brightwellii.AAC.1